MASSTTMTRNTMTVPAALWDDIPNKIEDITFSWVVAALSQRHPAAHIAAMEVGEVIRGASSKVRIRVRTDDVALPRDLIVKGGFEPHSHLMRGMQLNEMNAYRALVPTLPVRAPRCVFAGASSDGRAVVILEDLTAAKPTFLNLLNPLNFATAALFLSDLARIHARWWASPELQSGGGFHWAPKPVEGRYLDYIERLTSAEVFKGFLVLPRAAACARSLAHSGLIRRGLAAMRRFHAGQAHTLCHGDTHLNNLYLCKDGAPGFLDWSPRNAPWQHEISYFLVAALDVPDRRRWEAALLNHYLAELKLLGLSPPAFDDAWLAYRREVMWGFFVFLLNDPHFQPESVNTAAASRFSAAMLDHDTYGLLGV